MKFYGQYHISKKNSSVTVPWEIADGTELAWSVVKCDDESFVSVAPVGMSEPEPEEATVVQSGTLILGKNRRLDLPAPVVEFIGSEDAIFIGMGSSMQLCSEKQYEEINSDYDELLSSLENAINLEGAMRDSNLEARTMLRYVFDKIGRRKEDTEPPECL